MCLKAQQFITKLLDSGLELPRCCLGDHSTTSHITILHQGNESYLPLEIFKHQEVEYYTNAQVTQAIFNSALNLKIVLGVYRRVIMFFVLYVVLGYHVSTAAGQTVSFSLDRNKATCKEPLTLGCFVNPFTGTDATWNRNNVLMSQCGDSGYCSVPGLTIGYTLYSFAGNVSGIFVSVSSLPIEEHGVIWSCIHSGTTYTYTFNVSCPVSSSRGISDGLSTDEKVGIGIAVSVAVLALIIVIIIICVPPKMSVDLKLSVNEKKGEITHTLIWSPAKQLCCGDVTYMVEDAEIDDNSTEHGFSKLNSHIKDCWQEIKTSTPNRGYLFRVKAKGLLVCSQPTNTARLDTITVTKRATVGANIGLLETELNNQLAIKHVRWYFREMAVNPNVIKFENGKPDVPALLIHTLTLDDAGFYNCKVILKDGSYKNYVVELEVIATKKAHFGETVTLLEEELKYLENIKDVRWYFGEKTVSAKKGKYQSGKRDVPALLIFDLSLEDSGIYQCKVIFQDDSHKNFFVDLEVAVVKKAHVGEKVSLLEKELKNERKIKDVVWYFRGNVVSAKTGKYQNGTRDASALLIVALTVDDAGIYNCKIVFKDDSNKNYFVDLEVSEPEDGTNL